jgi:hypothetical protein
MRAISSFSAAVALAFTVNANAGVIFFTDEAAWNAAAGAPSFTENFSSFAADTSFRTTPVALNGMTISQEGVNTDSFRNTVDVPPLDFPDNNGTAHSSTFTEGDAGTQVRIMFDALNSAFAFETWEAASGEGAILEVFAGGSLLGSRALTDGSGDFLGYVLDGGDTATSVLFRSITSNSSSGGEGFGLDNLVGVNALPSASVPEPGSLALLGVALGAFGLSRRRKKA